MGGGGLTRGSRGVSAYSRSAAVAGAGDRGTGDVAPSGRETLPLGLLAFLGGGRALGTLVFLLAERLLTVSKPSSLSAEEEEEPSSSISLPYS